MNKSRRATLKTTLLSLKRIVTMLERVRDDESDSLGNIPENLSSSERYRMMEDILDYLDDATSSLNDAIESIEHAIE